MCNDGAQMNCDVPVVFCIPRVALTYLKLIRLGPPLAISCLLICGNKNVFLKKENS